MAMMRRACVTSARHVYGTLSSSSVTSTAFATTSSAVAASAASAPSAASPATAVTPAAVAASMLRHKRRYCHDAAALSPFDSSKHQMSDKDKFLFDTNGFVVVKNVFSKEDLARFHSAVDAHADQIHERKGQLRLTAAKTPLSGDGKTGRKDLAGFLGWRGVVR